MSKQIRSNLFIFSPVAGNQSRFYQELLRGMRTYPELGSYLTRLAEFAHSLRQFNKVKEYGYMLANIPLKSYQAIGYYFLGVAANSKGKGNQEEAKKLFELVSSTAPDIYKIKSVVSLGALSFHKHDFESALNLYAETIRAGKFSAASLIATRGVATVKSIEGAHQSAIADLENVLPLAKHAPLHIYFDLLNSYAVELGEVGRREEARNIMRHVLASPFAQAYPEWRETAEDLRPARRSFVAAGLTHDNVLTLPERESSEQPTGQPARVLDLAEWKKQIAKKNNDRKTEKELNSMSVQDMGFKLLELITKNRPDRAQMRALLDFALNLFSQRSKLDPDGPAS